MAKYQVTEKIGCPLSHKIVRRCKYRYLWYAYKALAKNRWQSSKRRAVFSFGRRLACGSVCIGTDCASRSAGTVRIRFKKKETGKNQTESVSVRCRYCDSQTSVGADACGSGDEMFFGRENCLPVPIKNYFVTCELLCTRGGVSSF
jgi:hypothetical protein